MVEVTRYRPGDRGEVVALYARVFGAEAAGAFERRWDWMYGLNPNRPGGEPLIWLAREGGAIVGQYATMPVTLSVDGTEIDAAWGMDVMIAPEQQRRGLGNLLFATWDRHVGASIGLGLTDGSHALFTKLHWPDLGRVPRYVMPLSRRVLVDWGARRWGREVATLPWRRLVARVRPLGGEIRRISRFDEGVTRLWERVGRKFAFVVRRARDQCALQGLGSLLIP